jgi:peptidoglycan/xylan/chitin deacetylase (PgdA/CDA1 family)
MARGHDRAALVACALAVATVHAGPALCSWSPALRRGLGVRDRVGDAAAVALTFDDGPHPCGTPATLAALDRLGVRATFFLVGEQVRRDPGLAAEIVSAGHGVGVHCDRHRNLLRLSPAQVRHDLGRAEATIVAATARMPQLYRPPYGVLTSAGLGHARRRGWRPLLWSRWGHDWRRAASPATIAAEATASLSGGEVVLLHDADHYAAAGSWERTVAALPRIVEAIERAGLTVGSP